MMRFENLKPGDFVLIKGGAIKQWMKAQFLQTKPHHCQLHGEYICEKYQFRKLKWKNNLGGYLFDVRHDGIEGWELKRMELVEAA